MHEIMELKEKLCKELEEYGRKGDLDVGTLEIVDKLAHAVKNLGKIIEMYEEDDYSGAYRRGGNYANEGGRRGGGSYERGRSYAQRRDRMGRYSSEGGYSRGDIVEKLEEVMEDAPDEKTRKEIQRLIEKMM